LGSNDVSGVFHCNGRKSAIFLFPIFYPMFLNTCHMLRAPRWDNFHRVIDAAIAMTSQAMTSCYVTKIRSLLHD